MKRAFVMILAFTFVAALFPAAAGAYSYGDPNHEKLAEVYTKMIAGLNGEPPDYAGARAAFDTIREELDMHMGKEPSQAVVDALEAKDKEKTITGLHKVMVLNIARRMDNIESDFDNYKQNKILIAKSNATYEALSPLVKQENAELDGTMRKQFENALEALGNPGLFGVGEKKADPAAFKTNKDAILAALQQQFKIDNVNVGHYSGEEGGNGTTKTEKGGNKAGFDLSESKNWIPIAVIMLALAAIIVIAVRRRRS